MMNEAAGWMVLWAALWGCRGTDDDDAIQTYRRPTEATPFKACHFLENLLRNDCEFWWDKLFRFTPHEFFKELVPILDLPDNFTIDG